MRIESAKKLFVGIRVDAKMKDQLDKCPDRDRVYFEGQDARYLMTIHGSGGDSYLGKVVDGATPTTALEDLRRNIVSILNRICPGRRDQEDIKIFATAEGEPTVGSLRHDEAQGNPPQSNRGGGYY